MRHIFRQQTTSQNTHKMISHGFEVNAIKNNWHFIRMNVGAFLCMSTNVLRIIRIVHRTTRVRRTYSYNVT